MEEAAFLAQREAGGPGGNSWSRADCTSTVQAATLHGRVNTASQGGGALHGETGNIHWPVHCTHCTVSSVQCTVNNVQCTVYSVQCKVGAAALWPVGGSR